MGWNGVPVPAHSSLESELQGPDQILPSTCPFPAPQQHGTQGHSTFIHMCVGVVTSATVKGKWGGGFWSVLFQVPCSREKQLPPQFHEYLQSTAGPCVPPMSLVQHGQLGPGAALGLALGSGAHAARPSPQKGLLQCRLSFRLSGLCGHPLGDKTLERQCRSAGCTLQGREGSWAKNRSHVLGPMSRGFQPQANGMVAPFN